MWPIVAVFLLLAVGVVATLVATRINRKEIDLYKCARDSIRERLRKQTNSQSLEAVFDECEIHRDEWGKATKLVDTLRSVVGLPNWIPPIDIRLGELLRVRVSELRTASSVTSDDGPEFIEPFTYDIVDHLLTIGEKSTWTQRWSDDANFPRDDDELGNFIMNMTLRQFVVFFLPLINPRPAKP